MWEDVFSCLAALTKFTTWKLYLLRGDEIKHCHFQLLLSIYYLMCYGRPII